jgi:glycosyltransferase involved in cell wall biosynthesis
LSNSMRILHCIPNMAGGGAERQLVYLSGELVKRGWDVHIALLKEGPNFERLVSTGCKIHKIPAFGNHDLTIMWSIMKLIRTIRPHLVQTWLTQMDVFGGAAARLTGVPYILSERSSTLQYPQGFKNWLRVSIGGRATAVISNSDGGNEYWQTQIKNSIPKYVIQNSIPLADIENAIPSINNLQISLASKMLIFVGRFSPEKNIANIINAFRMVTSERDAMLLLCGEGPLRPRIEEMISKQNLTDRVILPGYIENIWGLMKRANLFIAVSSFEGQPNAVLEAMACGCPLILSDMPAHRAFLDESQAIFVDPGNVIAISDAISTCIENPEMAKKMADRAKAAAALFSIESVADQYEKIYDQILINQKHRKN